MKRTIVNIGDRVGMLTIVREGPSAQSPTANNRRVWALCDCGTETLRYSSGLSKLARTGGNASCGCINHHLTKSIEYTAWVNMKDRCMNKNHKSYKHYGGRGIRVSDEWLGPRGFAAFLAHVGNRPSPTHSLDRIDTNGNYEPGNVRWADPRTQLGNRRNVKRYIFNGRIQNLTEWAREYGIGLMTVRHRMLKMGWAIDRALTTPVKH